jgi:hypothetical protein
MSDRETRLTLTEAIDRAGPVLFGADWIDRLKPKDAKILAEFGPKPFGQPRQSIGPCPREWAVKLDRAMGRDARLVVQRTTVLDWIFSARVMTTLNHCDQAALNRVLERHRPAKAGKGGAPPLVRYRLITQMLEDIHRGKRTADELEALKEETLAELYGASRNACRPARIAALDEAKRRGLI